MPIRLPDHWMAAWSLPVVPLIGLSLLLMVYVRGWWVAHRTRGQELPLWRAACFVAGVVSLWIAVASPIDALDDYLLTAHMLQHFILMSVAPPLMVLGAPTVPLLRGVPRVLIRCFVAAGVSRAVVSRGVQAGDASGVCVAGDEHCVSGLACAGDVRADI